MEFVLREPSAEPGVSREGGSICRCLLSIACSERSVAQVRLPVCCASWCSLWQLNSFPV